MVIDAKIKLTVAYDGSEFYGFQKQREEPTVQSVLEEALSRINHARIIATGAGRTDSGVHAVGQVVCFKPEVQIPVQNWPKALNAILPGSLVVKSAQVVDENFHPIRDAKYKVYVYYMKTADYLLPFERRYVYRVPVELDVREMQRAGLKLIGKKDFASFQVTGRPVVSTIRKMYQLGLRREENDLIVVKLIANGFLYKMARSIVGTLIEVGRGNLTPEDLDDILNARDRRRAGPTAKAYGLTLLNVQY